MVVLSGLVRLCWLLRDQVDSSLVIRLDANSLLINEASVCPGVLVGEVHRIAREHNSASGSALHEVGILITYPRAISGAISSHKRVYSRAISQMRSAEIFGRSAILYGCLAGEICERC
jgi:hypothetical protein